VATDFLLAVDAGGTKTTAWLVDAGDDAEHQVLGHGRSTGGNPLSVGFDDATRAIMEAVAQAHSSANRPVAQVGRIIMSIAGAADHGVREQLIAWAHNENLAHEVAIVSDFLPVLAAGAPDCCGVALICGTGSSAFARNSAGDTARCGGWGYLLGDEGSGFAIGRVALQHALTGLESKAPLEPLDVKLLSTLRAKSVSELTRVVYSSPDVRATIAGLAPLVIQLAAEGDFSASEILASAARDLAELVVRATRAAELTAGSIPLAVSGSVIVHAKPLRDRLQAELRCQDIEGAIHVVDEPLEGCIRLSASEYAGTLVQWQ
jgi:N-acetylglucosamine kinase-like BadF-type ATPase